MNKPVVPASFFLTFVLPIVHLALCIAADRGAIDDGWILLTTVDLPAGLLLGGLTFQGYGPPLLWFGVFGTLWWFLVSWGAWSTRCLLAERRRRTQVHRSPPPSGIDGGV
jgi:hypothetical protein